MGGCECGLDLKRGLKGCWSGNEGVGEAGWFRACGSRRGICCAGGSVAEIGEGHSEEKGCESKWRAGHGYERRQSRFRRSLS